MSRRARLGKISPIPAATRDAERGVQAGAALPAFQPPVALGDFGGVGAPESLPEGPIRGHQGPAVFSTPAMRTFTC